MASTKVLRPPPAVGLVLANFSNRASNLLAGLQEDNRELQVRVRAWRRGGASAALQSMGA